MKTNELGSLINQLSESMSNVEQMIIKSFLSGTYKSDYDRVMAIIDKNVHVTKISKDTIDNAVECTKLFNEAFALSQNRNEEQKKEDEVRIKKLAQEFKDHCYRTIENYGIKIE